MHPAGFALLEPFFQSDGWAESCFSLVVLSTLVPLTSGAQRQHIALAYTECVSCVCSPWKLISAGSCCWLSLQGEHTKLIMPCNLKEITFTEKIPSIFQLLIFQNAKGIIYLFILQYFHFYFRPERIKA